MTGIIRDARYACRILRRSPGFALTAVLTLGLAIAVNTAVFSVVDAVLLKPLPYPHPDDLALVTTRSTANGTTREELAQNGVTWEMVRDHAATIDRAVFSTWTAGVNVVAGDRASHVQQQRVGAGFFAVLGVHPRLGREFTLEEDRRRGPVATVLSHGLWQSMFGGDPSVVGRTLLLRGEVATIVGVMPDRFQTGERADLWTPLRASTAGEGEGENYMILARYRPGIDARQADGEVRQLGVELLRQRPPAERTEVTFGLQPLQQGLTADLRRPLLLLWLAVGIVLLIASVNLAGLLMARASRRTQELATRLALGSGRRAVVRQLVVEGVVLAGLGAAPGIASASVVLDTLKAMASHVFEIWQPVSLDLRAVAAAGLLALAASVVFGLLPAVLTTRVNVQAALVDAGARAVAGGRSRWPRHALLMAQVALSVVLLLGAGLLLRTYSHLQHLNSGFDPADLTTVSISLEDARYGSAAHVTQIVDDTLTRIRATSEIESAAVSLGLPYERLLNLGFRHLDGPQASAARGRMTSATYVAGDYFQTMRIPVQAGRTFDDHDRAGAPGVVIVNETLAHQYFDDASPIGHRIRFAGLDREIIGVVGDVQVRPGWGDFGPIAAMPLAYLPLGQANDGLLRLVHGWFAPSFVVRSSASTETTATALRRALDLSDPLLPFAAVRRMTDVQAVALARPRVLMTLLAGLAVAAVVLAAIGIHGLIATSVSERTREMGIRLALGASLSQVLRSLALPGIGLACAGTLIGGASAMALGGLVRHFLWGVTATDPVTFASVAIVLVAVASIASVVPALRILRLDPARALRQD